jgi:hypothetical protein
MPVVPEVPVTTSGALERAIDIRGDTIEALKRTEQTLGRAEAVGGETAVQMHKNREAIGRIEAEIAPVVVPSARQQAITIMRNVAKSKCFMALSCLVILVGVAIIFVVFLYKPKQSQVPAYVPLNETDNNSTFLF